MDPVASNKNRRGKRIRTVQSLSEEQVQRKRNVDRRAQRAFRQKTKDSIHNLEQQIAQIKEVCNEKDHELSTLREQNNQLLRRLISFKDPCFDAVRPSCQAIGRNDADFSSCEPVGVLAVAQSLIPSVTSFTNSNGRTSPPCMSSEAMKAPQIESSQAIWGHVAAHSITPLHLPPTCPLDHILLSFVASGRAMVSQGTELRNILGDHRPSVKALFEEGSAISLHPLSALLSEVLKTFPGMRITERLAFFYVMSLTVKVINPLKMFKHSKHTDSSGFSG